MAHGLSGESANDDSGKDLSTAVPGSSRQGTSHFHSLPGIKLTYLAPPHPITKGFL